MYQPRYAHRWIRVHQTRFWLIEWVDGRRSGAVVDDFGNLVSTIWDDD